MKVYLIDYTVSQNLYSKLMAINTNLLRLHNYFFTSSYRRSGLLDRLLIREYFIENRQAKKIVLNKIRDAENLAFRFGH